MTEHPFRRMGNNLNIEFSILENPVKLCLEFRGDTALENRALKMGISIPTPLRCIHARTLSTPFQISAEIKIIFTRRREREKRGKRRSIPATFPLCTHDARDESWTLSRDGIRWVRKPFEKESSGCGGGEGRARRKCFLSFPLLRGNLRFESPPGVHKSCVLGFRGSGN